LSKAARIEVPIFLGNGDLDVSADFHAEPATYPLARDITLFQLAGSAHCHNFATTRTTLWDRLVRWIQAINPGRRNLSAQQNTMRKEPRYAHRCPRPLLP